MKKLFISLALSLSSLLGFSGATVTFTNLNTTSMKVNWSGVSTNVLVVMRAGGAPNSPPNGSTTYNGNPTFGTGYNLGNQSYVVFNSNGTFVTVTNLIANTFYYVDVYTYVTVFGSNTYTLQGSSGHYTLAAQPTSASTALTVDKIKPTSAHISCTAPSSGGGAYRLITVKASTTNTELPVDGTGYAASSAFTSGDIIVTSAYAVSSNFQTSMTVSGLSPGTTYAVSIFEYNGLSGANNYLTSSYPTTSFTTPAAEPTSVPTAFSATNITATSTTLNFTNGDGAKRIVTVQQNPHNKTALAFDGVDDYLYVGNPTGVNAGTGSFTMEAWIKTTDALYTYKTIVSKQNAFGSTGYWLGTYGGYVYFELATSPGGIGNIASTWVTSQAIADGAWHHVALVGNRSTGLNCSVYIDGVLESSTTSSLSATLDNTNDFTIGARNGTGDFFVGQMDEVRLWNNARSQANIIINMYTNVNAVHANLYGCWHMNDGGVGGGVAKNDANNTGNTLDATLKKFNSVAIANSFTLLSGWVYSGAGIAAPKDGTTYTPNSIFASGTQIGDAYVVMDGTANTVDITGLTPQTDYSVCVYEYNGLTTTINYLTSTHLVGAFKTPTTEPTTAATGLTLTPASPTSITASWTNGNGAGRMVLVHPGKEQTGLSFDGVNDSVSIPHNTALNTYPMTITAWIKTSQVAGSLSGIVGKYKYSSANGYSLYLYNGLLYGYYGSAGGLSTTYVNSGTSIADGVWHHIAYSVDASGCKLYIDGVLRSSSAWTGAAAACNTTQNLTFGYMPGSSLGYSGQLDEVAVYNSALSISTINYTKNRSLYGGYESYYSSLKGYWKLDEGSATSSSIANSSLTTLTNGTLYAFASTAAATNFTGTSGWVYSGATLNFPVDQSSGTYYGNSIYSSSVTYYGNFLGNISYYVYVGTGSSVTVTGLSPNATYNFSVLEFNGSAGDYNFMTSSYLTGNVSAQTQSAPTITSFSPVSGTIGTQVTITGTNFNTTTASNIVSFGAVKATVLSATATQLVVLVPAGATFESIAVNNNALIGYSSVPFNVTLGSCSQSILDTRFSASSSLTSNGSVAALQVVDMDMDGRDDLLALNDVNGNMSGFRNSSTGGSISFINPSYSMAVLRALPSGFAAEDFDGDGKQDVISVNKTTNTLIISRSISFSGYVQAATEGEFNTLASPQSVAVADLDKDGRIDVIVGYANDSISIFRNTSSTNYISFAARIDKALVAGTTSAKVAVGDMDNDGKVDIVVGCTGTTNMLSSFRNTTTSTGNITLATRADYTTGITGAINAIAIGKITNDNFPEVCITQGNTNVVVAKNNSVSGTSISFTSSGGVTLTTFANTPADVAISDIDGDTYNDVVVGYSNNASGAKVSLFENNNSTTTAAFNGVVNLAVAGTAPTSSLAIGDFNNDGKNDIAAGSNSTSVVVFTNNIGGALSSEPSLPATVPASSSVTTTTATLTWTNSLGSSGALVVVKPNTDVQVNPIDGIDYVAVANTNYGSAYLLGANNKVVYANSSNTVNITGLTSNTTYRFYVYEYVGSGCDINYLTSSTANTTFTMLNNAPTLNTISNPSNICQGVGTQTVNISGITDGGEANQTLTVSATSNNTTLIPSVTSNYTMGTTGSLTYTPTSGKSGTAIITVTVNDGGSNNNTAVKTFTVTVDATPPTAVAGSNQLSLCSSTATLGATSPGGGFTGTWSIIYQTPGGLTATIVSPTNPTSTVNNIDVGDSVILRWTVSSGSACTPTTADISIKRINCSISADFTADKTTVCKNSNVNFSDLSATQSGAINTWTWNFGDAGTSNSQNPSHPYTVAGTYTVSLTVTNTLAANASTTKNAFITVTDVPVAANSITGVSPVCAGQLNAELFLTTAISGATNYAWTLPTGASITSGDSTINVYIAFANNAASGDVSVAGKNSCGTGTASTFSVTLKSKPDDAGSISGTAIVCDGSTLVTYSVSAINNASSYSWSTTGGSVINGGNGTNTIDVNFPGGVAVSGDVSVYGTNTNGCGTGNSSSFPVIVNTKPDAAGSINGSTSIALCPIQTGVSYSVPLVNGADSLLWNVPGGAIINSGQGSNSIAVDYSTLSTNGTISVVGKNNCGYGDSSYVNISIDGPGIENVCYVTVDSATGNFNKVIWEKAVSNVDSFYIYRLVPFGTKYLNSVPPGKAGGFEKVGTQSYGALSEFADVIYTTPSADPNAEAATYLVTTLDACGNESAPGSAAHTSVFLQSSMALNGWNLAWNAYEGNTVGGYIILRDTTGSQFDSLTVTPNTNYTDVLPPSLVGVNIRYRVVTVWNLPCSGPNLKVVTTTIKSISNIKSLLFVGMNEIEFDNQLKIFPNPAADLLNIDFPVMDEKVTFTLVDMLGQQMQLSCIETATSAGKSLSMNTSQIPAGIYNLSIQSSKISLLKKIVVQ